MLGRHREGESSCHENTQLIHQTASGAIGDDTLTISRSNLLLEGHKKSLRRYPNSKALSLKH